MTNQEIKDTGLLIRNEQQIGGNTALRVGGVIEGIGYALDNKDAANGYYQATINRGSISVNAPNFVLGTGGNLRIKMPAAGTTASTLTIGNASNVQLWYNGAAVSSDNTWEADEIISVFYDGNRFMASNSQGGGGKAEKIKYDNSQSGLAAENVQGAVDELSQNVAKQDYLPYQWTAMTTSSMSIVSGYSLGSTGLIRGNGRSVYRLLTSQFKQVPRKIRITAKSNVDADIAFAQGHSGTTLWFADSASTSYHSIPHGTTQEFEIQENAIYIYINNYSTANVFPAYLGLMFDEIDGGDLKEYIDIKTNDYSDYGKVYYNNDILFTNEEVPAGTQFSWEVTLQGVLDGTDNTGYISLYDANGTQLSYFGKSSRTTSDTSVSGSMTIPSGFAYAKMITSLPDGTQYNMSAVLGDGNVSAASLDSVFNIGWTSGKYIDSSGGISSYSSSVYSVSGDIILSEIADYICVGWNCYSTTYDMRTWALYDSSDNKVAIADPSDSNSYGRLITIDFSELATQYPTAEKVRIGCHNNYLMRVARKGSPAEQIIQNQIALERPQKGGLDNFTFASAGSDGIINIVSNVDADASLYENNFVNFAQVLKIGDYWACFYFANGSSSPTQWTEEYAQNILCAYSSDGTTWTRGFPPGVTPPVAGTPLLFDPSASGYKPITEACWCRVPDNDYPYRMIGNTNATGAVNKKKCTMWKSADGYNYIEMGYILDDVHRDTQYSAVVRGNVIKLYCRQSDTTPHGYLRSISVAYIDIDGNILTQCHKIIYDYMYTSAACVLDNTRELLIPTWFANDIDSAPKTENAHLETYIVEGDKYEKVETNINDCLNNDTLWMAVSQDFISIGYEQYILVNERNTDHASAMDKSSIKLVKVTRT